MVKKQKEPVMKAGISQLGVAVLLLDAEAALMRARAACLRKDSQALFDRMMEARGHINEVMLLIVRQK